MCKLIGISALSVMGRKQSNAIVKATSEMLGLSQRDGYGFAIGSGSVSDMTVNVYMERYLNPNAVTGMGTVKQSRGILPSAIRTQLKEGVDYDSNGIMPVGKYENSSFIAHGRTATCGKVLANTHPFTGKNNGLQWTIAHNGVVEWTGIKLPLQTTCDSEHLLNCFLYLQGEQSFADGISGYAAITGINPEGEMFALRDDRAPLYVQYILELKSFIVATDQTHCSAISKMLTAFKKIKNAVITEPLMLEPYVMHTFHKNGNVSSKDFRAFKSTMSYASCSSVYRSLGSAGAIGYGSSAWEDDVYGYSSHKTPSPVTAPIVTVSTPTPETNEADEQQKQIIKQYERNNRRRLKPWKQD